MYWDERKTSICWSLSNTFQFVTLSGIEGLYINSIEKFCEEKPSDGISLDAVLANRSVLKLCDLGTYLKLNARKELVRSLINL